MANTIGTPTIDRQRFQFQGAFSDMFAVSATISDQDAISATDTTTFSLTVPGAALGDFCFCSIDNDLSDGTDQAIIQATVTSANTVGVRITADAGAYAADDLNSATVKVLVCRPTW